MKLVEDFRTAFYVFNLSDEVFKISVCFVALFTLVNLWKFFKAKKEKKLRYRIFLLDGWCLLRQICGYCLFKMAINIYILLEIGYIKWLIVDIVKWLIFSIVCFGISTFMTKYTATLEEYYDGEIIIKEKTKK